MLIKYVQDTSVSTMSNKGDSQFHISPVKFGNRKIWYTANFPVIKGQS